MDNLGVALSIIFFIVIGIIITSFFGGHDITQKEIAKAQEKCQANGGFYKLTSRFIGNTVYCKDGNSFLIGNN